MIYLLARRSNIMSHGQKILIFVSAANEESARKYAFVETEGDLTWMDAEESTCKELSIANEGVLMMIDCPN